MSEEYQSSNIAGISIILPIHKQHEYIDASILSCINQHYSRFETIIVVNGNDKNLYERLKSKYESNSTSILYTPIPSLPHALNIGIEAAKYDYIARMDSDDICLLNRLEIISKIIANDKDIDVISGKYYKINKSGERISEKKYGFNFSKKSVRRKLAYRCILAHPTICFKKDSIIKAGGYSYGSFSEDYDLWLRLSRNTDINFTSTDDALIEYRIHENQATANNSLKKILSYDVALKIRELIFTGKSIYLAGAIYSIAYFFYQKLKNLNIKTYPIRTRENKSQSIPKP